MVITVRGLISEKLPWAYFLCFSQKNTTGNFIMCVGTFISNRLKLRDRLKHGALSQCRNWKASPYPFFSNGLIFQVLYLQIHTNSLDRKKIKYKEGKCLLSKAFHPIAILVCSCVYVHSN